MTASAVVLPPVTPLALRRQIAWAQGQAKQHERIAKREAPGSTGRLRALERQQVALATVRTLQSLEPRTRK